MYVIMSRVYGCPQSEGNIGVPGAGVAGHYDF